MATQTSHTPAHESAATVAPFRAWRSSQHVVARGPEWVTIEGAYPSELAERSVATLLYSFHELPLYQIAVTWPLFAVIQLVMLTVGVSVAFLLRNRSLKARYRALQDGLEASEAAIAMAMSRVTDGAEKIWLQDRLAELPDEGELPAIQRLVLANELELDSDFEKNLTEILSSADAARDAVAEQWAKTRESAHNLAAGLIDRYPLSHPVIVQMHDAYGSLDQALGTSPEPLPDAPELSEADPTDATQEAEHLRATNDLLQQELDKLRGELSQQSADGANADEQAEDLKGLLQQFTKDSRDMMACIQKLEAENANLRQQLGLSSDQPAMPPPDASPDAGGAQSTNPTT